MSNNFAIESLLKERTKLVGERDAKISAYNKLIGELEFSIETISGKKVWEVEPTVVYDDENPDYIKGSIED